MASDSENEFISHDKNLVEDYYTYWYRKGENIEMTKQVKTSDGLLNF